MIAPLLAAMARVVAGSAVFWTEEPTPSPTIYIANHSSHLDFIVLWSSLPPAVRAVTRPVAARDYWDRGLRRYLATHAFNALLIDRGRGAAALLPAAESSGPAASPPIGRSHAAVDLMASVLDAHHSLILFPEGTRRRGGELGPFRSGLYHLCHARPSIPVVPVYMANLDRILPKGSLFPVPLLSRIVMGPALRVDPEESRDAFLARARDAITHLATAG